MPAQVQSKEQVMALTVLVVLAFIYVNSNQIWLRLNGFTVINGHTVLDRPDKYQAASILGEIKENIKALADSVGGVPRLRLCTWRESYFGEVPGKKAWVKDKGVEVGLVLRDPHTQKLLTVEQLMPRARHELAHIMTPIYEPKYGDHGPEFYKNLNRLGGPSEEEVQGA
jgi:hypothetical protein